MTNEQVFNETLDQLKDLSVDLKISIARRLLQESGCFCIDFWGKSDILEIFDQIQEDNEGFDGNTFDPLTDQEIAQISSDCDYYQAKYCEFDSDTLRDKINETIESRTSLDYNQSNQ